MLVLTSEVVRHLIIPRPLLVNAVITSVIVMATKATTIKEALKRWEDKYKISPSDAKEVQLQFQWPPIERMDNTLATLTNCE